MRNIVVVVVEGVVVVILVITIDRDVLEIFLRGTVDDRSVGDRTN